MENQVFNWDILQQNLVKNTPHSVYYIPNFITIEEEEYLLKKVYDVPKPKWTNLSNRRLQDYGGIPHKNGIIQDTIPSWLQTYMDRISDMGIFGAMRANHCLINEYKRGQGIMPHSDGPIFTPIITTITCGSHAVLEFYNESPMETREMKCKLLLERRSLIILTRQMYTEYLHGISEVECDQVDEAIRNLVFTKFKAKLGSVIERATRISLTIRNVPRVIKLNLIKK